MLLLGCILLLSLVVRWPYLVQMPELTDETLEIGRALSIARGERLPLTSYVTFTGPIFHYALAAVFKLFGPSLFAARFSVTVVGCLTVLATYLLARTLAGRAVGLLAAGFMATSSVHTIASGHLAWIHSTSPLFVTLVFWQLARAGRQKSRTSLALAALLLGLALQSHPSVFLLVPAVAIYGLWKARGLLTRKLAVSLVGLVALGYANMLLHNTSQGLNSVAEAWDKESDYSRTLPEGSRGYVGRAPEVLYTLVRLPGSKLDAAPLGQTPVVDLLAFSYAALAFVGLAILAVRGEPLPALGVAALALLLPLTSAQHALLPRQGRYLVPILPLLYAGLAVSLLGVVELGRRQRGWLVGVGIAGGLVLVFLPLIQTFSYYRSNEAAGRTNQRYFDAVSVLRRYQGDGTSLLLDEKLIQERTGAGGQALRSLQTLGALEGLSLGVFANEGKVEKQLGREAGDILLLSPSFPDDLSRRLADSPLMGEIVESRIGESPYQLYRLRLAQHPAVEGLGRP